MPNTQTIVVVGSINTDLVVTAPRLPVAGETLTGSRFSTFQGGKGANQAVAAARLGARVEMIGMVGDDAFGVTSRQQLQAHGVGCHHVGTVPGASGVALISVDERGRNTIIVVPGANAAVTPELVDAKRNVLRQAGMVLAQLEIPLPSVLRLAEVCHEEGVPLMLDPAPACELPRELLSLCEWFTPNETEAAFFAGARAGDTPPQEILATLRGRGARNIILKRGERGALVDTLGGESVSTAALPVEAVDTTAAGDTYNGAFAAACMQGRSIEACSRFAAAAAALSVTREGAQASMPDEAEVAAFLRQHGEVW